jgi:hypothetical protein
VHVNINEAARQRQKTKTTFRVALGGTEPIDTLGTVLFPLSFQGRKAGRAQIFNTTEKANLKPTALWQSNLSLI